MFIVEPGHLQDPAGRVAHRGRGEQRAAALHHLRPRPARPLGQCRREEHES